jgi:hypothetical protein
VAIVFCALPPHAWADAGGGMAATTPRMSNVKMLRGIQLMIDRLHEHEHEAQWRGDTAWTDGLFRGRE